ncbi:MAG: hypothetical protein WD178_05395 [Actinomycetota bacterium]
MNWIAVAWVAAVALGLFGLHLGALWMERRGWIFYKHTKVSSSAASNAFMQVQAIFEPGADYFVEERRSSEVRAVEDAEPGGPPNN